MEASVEETNRVRAELGLKPLATGASDEPRLGTSNRPIHAPAGEKKKPTEEQLKERIASSKHRREHEEFTKGESLGNILKGEGEKGASEWVAKMRAGGGAKAPSGPSAK